MSILSLIKKLFIYILPTWVYNLFQLLNYVKERIWPCKITKEMKLIYFFIILCVSHFAQTSAQCTCQSCGATSPANTRHCPTIGGVSGCNIVVVGPTVTSCTCASGGNCFTKQFLCDGWCATFTTTTTSTVQTPTFPPLSGIVTANLNGNCDASVEQALSNPTTTNSGASCSIGSCIVDISISKLTCSITFDTGDVNSQVTAIHIHWNAAPGIPVGVYPFPTSSFPSSVSSGTASITAVSIPKLSQAWQDSSPPITYINFHTTVNPAGSFAGRLSLVKTLTPSPGSSSTLDPPIFILVLILGLVLGLII